MASQQDKQAVEAVIQEWMSALSAGDIAGVKGVWDKSYDSLIYIAEENDDALHGWSGVNGYYDGLAGVTRADWK